MKKSIRSEKKKLKRTIKGWCRVKICKGNNKLITYFLNDKKVHFKLAHLLPKITNYNHPKIIKDSFKKEGNCGGWEFNIFVEIK